MSLFNVDFDALVSNLFGSIVRKARSVALAMSYTAPIRWLYDAFVWGRGRNVYILKHTGQVCYLEAVLNDRFDEVARRIKIVDMPAYDPVYIYQQSEDKPVFIYQRSENQPVYIYQNIESATGQGFIVEVPAAVPFDGAEMRALIDRYRLAGMVNYEIKTV